MTRRRPISLAVAAALVAAIASLGTLTIARVDATPGSGASTTILARGTSAHDVKVHVKGPTDSVFAEVTIEPGGDTGWHSHPGPLLVAVRSGTLTRYDAD